MTKHFQNRIVAGKFGAGRFDFKRNSEQDLELEEDAALNRLVASVSAPQSIPGGGNLFISRKYLRTINAIDDAKTTKELALALQGLIGTRGRIRGFATPNLDLERTREASRTLADMFAKYPEIKADVEVLRFGDKNLYAQAVGKRSRGSKTYDMQTIQLSQKFLMEDSRLDNSIESIGNSGWVHLEPTRTERVTKMQYVVIHEFGHLMDYSSNDVDPHQVQYEHATELGYTDMSDPALVQYFEENSSRYGKTSKAEMLAEAFADVEVNGDDAFEYSKAVHAALVKSVQDKHRPS